MRAFRSQQGSGTALHTQGGRTLPHGKAALKRKGPYLIDYACTLGNEALANAVQCLKVELVN